MRRYTHRSCGPGALMMRSEPSDLEIAAVPLLGLGCRGPRTQSRTARRTKQKVRHQCDAVPARTCRQPRGHAGEGNAAPLGLDTFRGVVVQLIFREDSLGNIPLGEIAVSTSLSSRNEPGNPGLHYGIKPDPQLDSFANLPHGLFRKGGDLEVLADPAGGLRRGQEGRPAAGWPRRAEPAPGSY